MDVQGPHEFGITRIKQASHVENHRQLLQSIICLILYGEWIKRTCIKKRIPTIVQNMRIAMNDVSDKKAQMDRAEVVKKFSDALNT